MWVLRSLRTAMTDKPELDKFSTLQVKLNYLCGLVSGFLATDPEVQVRFPALPDFLRSCGYGTG
jgi:hypothetical protein